MKSPRLLPVVIFAAIALLLFKGLGIVTSGGYVLTGTTAVQAANNPKEGAPAEVTASTAAAAQTEPTMTDSSPTLTDTAPTIGAATGHAAKPGTTPKQGEAPAAGATTETAAAAPAAAPAAATAPASAPAAAAPAAASTPAAAPAADRHPPTYRPTALSRDQRR